MKKLIALICLVTPVSFGSPTLYANDSTTEMTFTVRLLNYADVKDDLVVQAQGETAAVFRKISIKINWRDIEVPKKKRTNAEILAAEPPQELQLSVHLLPKAKQWHPKGAVLGYALRRESEPGRLVSIFYDRLKTLVKRTKAISHWAPTEAELLGHIMAHEIGHQLLPYLSHTTDGIMTHDWNLDIMQDAARGDLGFSSEQGELIRAQLAQTANSGFSRTG